MDRLHALSSWLARHGPGQVQRLRLSLRPADEPPDPPPGPVLTPDEWLEMCTLLAAALPACAGRLQDLQLYLYVTWPDYEDYPELRFGAWMARLGSLRRLVSGLVIAGVAVRGMLCVFVAA